MRTTFKVLLMVSALFIVNPASSFADRDDHHDGHDRDRHHDEHRYHHDRDDYISFSFSTWPDTYYYQEPYYYPPAQTVLVSPPVYQPVIVNGTTYYLNNGTYYIYNGYGYQAVPAPVQTIGVIEPPVVVDNQAQVLAEGSFTINIPNDKGGYTAVTLRKSGNGFTGPQGEFYPEFPTVSKLKVVYGK